MKTAKYKRVIAAGVYLLGDGSFRAVARVGTKNHGTERRKERRFPRGTSLRDMKTWQEGERAGMRRETLRPVRGTLAGDVERYMRIMRQRLESPESREYETATWLTRFGHRRRDGIEREEIRQQVLDWEAAGAAASTIRHRLTALSQLYETLDGEGAHNPVHGLKRPREPKATPDGRSPQTVQAVLAALQARAKKHNRGWKTLARAKVIALTGMRHSQVMRLEPDHVFIEGDHPYVVVVDPGKNGEPHVKPLTPDGVEAFRLFNDKAAWGDFSQSSLYKSWKLACRTADVPFFNPYKLRHSYATALRAEGIDLADVQTLLGHKSAKTTARYAGVAPHKLTAAAAALQRAWHSVGSGEPDKSAGAAAQQTPERTDGEVASASHEASGQAKAWHRSVAPGKSSR